MALTNIELYEQLKKDVSEESARMIAEVVPKASDIATIGALEAVRNELLMQIAELRAEMLARFGALEVAFEQRFASMERRTFRYAMVFAAPLWAAMVAALVKIVLEI